MSDFIETLKERTSFSDEIVEKLNEFNEILYKKNEHINLTGIKKEESVYRNFLDSLNPVALRELADAKSIIDIGSGSGFPAVALAIVFPHKKITMVESTGKKAAFLKETVYELGLTNAEIVNARAEELAHDSAYREKYGAATARAVAAVNIICELSSGFVRPGGKLVFYKGAKAQKEAEEAKNIFKTLGLSICNIERYSVSGEDDDLYMIIQDKKGLINKNYPRKYSNIIQKK